MLITMSLFIVKAYASEQIPWLNSNIYGAVKDYDPVLNDDFYAHVNHEWLVNSKLKPGHFRTSAFNELQDLIDANLKAMMTDKDLTGHDAELVKNLYAIWLNWDARNQSGLGDLQEHIDKIKAITTLDDLNKYFMSDESLYMDLGIFDYGLGRDNKNSELYNLEIGTTSLSLGDAAEYKSLSPNGERTRKFNDSIASYMFERLNYSEQEISEILAKAFEFEQKIAASMMAVEELYSPDAIEKMYNPVSMNDLREKSKSFPLADILEAHGALSNLINLEEPEWLEALNDLYTPENLECMKLYLLRNLVSGYISKIDEPAYREYQKFSNIRNGITTSKPDEEIAVDFVHGNLSVPVSKLYVSRHVSEQTKHEIEQIIRDTVEYYRTMLANERWLSQSTRVQAIEKLNAMRLNSAYPDKWVDHSELVINSDDSLISTLMTLKKFKARKYFYERLNKSVDHDLWINDVVVVNSYYRPSENSINIIAGILGGDFYSPDMSYEEKLGGIGAVIGHEISHAFDTNGAQFDKTGNVSSWWTDEDYKEFKSRADRLIKYFDSMKVDDSDKNYNGSLVQTESIADMAGVKAMLGIAEDHEGFDYDKFFRQYSRIWKFTQTTERLDWVLRNDVHALPYLRVNAIVQQYEKFYDTYKITSHDKMYLAPAERVAVW